MKTKSKTTKVYRIFKKGKFISRTHHLSIAADLRIMGFSYDIRTAKVG